MEVVVTDRFYCIYIRLPAADAVFPMDVLTGNTLHGFVSGTTTGNPVLVPGKVGSALYLNGVSQFVNMGTHSGECFHNPNLCTNGVTVSVWLMALQPQHSDETIVFDNGGMTTDSVGFTWRRTQDNDMEILIQDNNGFSKIRTPAWSWVQDRWAHITFSWYPGSNITLYINGCDVDEGGAKGYAAQFGRLFPFTRFRPFYFGKFAWGFRYAHIKVDQLQFWYEVLPRASVWKLYREGG